MKKGLVVAGTLTLVLASAAPAWADTVAIDRADYFTNASGAFVSIEARGAGAATTLTAHVAGAADTPMQPFSDDGSYLEHRALVPVGSRPATVRVTSADSGSDTLDVRDWAAGPGTQTPAGYQQDFQTSYVDPQQAYERIRDLAAEFPGLAQVYNLPVKTDGYQRYAQAIVGTAQPYSGGRTPLTGAEAAKAVVLTSTAFGQDGGNDVGISLNTPPLPNQPLGVSASGSEITVSLATDATSAIATTASQLVDALNASPAVSALVRATAYRGNAGAGIVSPTAHTTLSDFLDAPVSYPRGPQTVQMLRIGVHRDGSRPGVLLYAQERGNELVTPLVTLEAAERLLRNYGTDPDTTALLDGLDVFVVPSLNPDGGAYAIYDSASPDRGKNMTASCAEPGATDPIARDDWGADISRNFSVGSFFDGFAGADSSCTSDVFAGPFELSEPESRDLQWVASTFPNIGVAMGVRGSGSRLTWSPGTYRAAGRELPPVRPSGVQDRWLEATAQSIADHMKADRQTVIPPQRTGARVDVSDSAAGNPVDYLFYSGGVLAFELGVGRPQPSFAEGHAEALESADGVNGLLDAALARADDSAPPQVHVTPAPAGPSRPVAVSFASDEPAEIHYTLDGSDPDGGSPVWEPADPRGRPAPLAIDHTTTVKWIATDVKGNASPVGSARFVIDAVAPATAAAVAPGATSGWRRAATVALAATDDASGVAATEYALDGGPWRDYAGPVTVTGDGARTFAYRSRDAAGNVEATWSLALRLDATAPLTTAQVAPAAVGGWYRSPAVALGASDAGAGVAATEYSLDGGPWRPYTAPVAVAGDGRHAFAYRSRDAVGNVEDARSLTVPVDATAPAISLAVPRLAVLARGQRRRARYRCSDAGSGVALCRGTRRSGARLDTRSAGRHALVVRASDAAGNETARRWRYTVLARLPKLRVRHRGGRLRHGGPRLALTDRLATTVKISGVLHARKGGRRIRVHLRTTHVHLDAGATRTVRVPLRRGGAGRLRGAHAFVATLRFVTTTGDLHRITKRRLRL